MMAAERSYRVKGTTFRAHVNYLKRAGKLDAVITKLSSEAAETVRNLPLPASWVDGHALDEIVQAVDVLEGRSGIFEMERGVIDGELLAFFFPGIRAIMRIAGTSPATLYERMDKLLRITIQGIDFRYTPTSPKSGIMETHYHTSHPIRRCSFLSTVPALELVLSLCGAPGVVSDPEILGQQSARYQIRW